MRLLNLLFLCFNSGAGQEVGRSCIILEFKGRKIMVRYLCLSRVHFSLEEVPGALLCVSLQLDCGIHPGLEGMDALPYIDLIDPAEIDLLLISQWVSLVSLSFAPNSVLVLFAWESGLLNTVEPLLLLFPPLKFPFGPLWCFAMVSTEDKLQRKNLHDTCN